ncbi:lipoprotein N-acyltransferase Lnb domain-containing protein [Winogradskyella ouciana]|uniref:DUF4105 domain-containing protein n=1 Tax=Winogradskyella ouciana TaxID=2608631 RepID=A0A7K1GDL8_9FLAO|nr:DUF4105 domain-containing protein [Winogradskyella ouciana]MTE27407.1 DUF4105 domain-containing protein [Winogradskyella ouciana]
MKLKLSFFLFLFVYVSSLGQQIQLTEDAEVSVLTFGPGESLNDAFGHNAFRIKDKSKGIDLVYGYGEYDFDAPNFYLKFARGKLNYLISRHNFSNIYYHYTSYNRSIDQQVLNFNLKEKQSLFDFLENNYKPENRRYLYDFFYDNCATKIRDVSETVTNSPINFSLPEDFQQKTFRELIHEHVDRNSWGSLGIDMALGSVIDRNASANEYMFLPKYIHSFFEVAKIGNRDFVKTSSTLYERKERKASFDFLLSPLVILGLIALLILYITYKDYKNKKRSHWLDVTLFSITGIIGVLLLLLWFATDHTATAHNYNLLWAVPLNIVVIGQLFKKQPKNWFRSYLKFLIIMLCLMTLHWIIGVQVFAIGLAPLLVALAVRYIYLIKYFK